MGVKDTLKRLEQLSQYRQFKLPVIEKIDGEYFLALTSSTTRPDDIKYAIYNPTTDKEITLEHYCKMVEKCGSPTEKAALNVYLQNMIIDTTSNLSLSQLSTDPLTTNSFIDNARLTQTKVSAKTYLGQKGSTMRVNYTSDELASFTDTIGDTKTYSMPILLDGHLLDIAKSDMVDMSQGVCVLSNDIRRKQNRLYLPPFAFVTEDKAKALDESILTAISKISDKDAQTLLTSRYADVTKRTGAITRAYHNESSIANRDAIPNTMLLTCDYASDAFRFGVPAMVTPSTTFTRSGSSRKAKEIISYIKGKYVLENNDGTTIEGQDATLRLKGEDPFAYEIIK